MTPIIVFPILILFVISVLYKLFKYYEKIVCTEVCNKFSNMISTLDQLCAINNDVKKIWKQVMFEISTSGVIIYENSHKYKDAITHSKKDLDNILQIVPSISLSLSTMTSLVLLKHKLTVSEVNACDTFMNATIDQLKDLLDKVNENIDKKQQLYTNLLMVDAEIECFQLEANAGFYGAMEGMCSFPESTKTTFVQLYPSIKFLPIEVGFNRRKEDYSFLQDQAYNEAEKKIKSIKEKIGLDEKLVGEYANTVLHKDINFFFAGAKDLQDERDMFANVISQIQTKLKNSLISVYGYSYQNFDRKIIEGGHEKEYCSFIKNNTDSIIFVLNERIGDYTLLEFNVALEAFKQSGTPKIYIYSKKSDISSSTLNIIKTE